MKAMLFLLCSLSLSAFAARSTVYCESEGHIYNALSEEGHYKCAYSLMDNGACFTGQRSEVIALINQDSFNWDEEWLEGAHYKGQDEIAYLFVDGPNEFKDPVSMSRCTDSFFQR